MNFKTKQIFSIALCIILIVFLLPITVSADTGDTYKYQYAYDVARSPAFPKSGEKEALSAFKPAITILDNGKFDFGATTSGDWTLISVGNYDPTKPYVTEKSVTTLENLVPNIVSKYGIASDKIEVFELKDGNKHICYGVIAAYFDDDGLLFIGTSHSHTYGAGYYISNSSYKSSNQKNLITQLDLANMSKLKEYKSKENKNTDNSSSEINGKQDNKDIDNNSTELNDKQDNKDIDNNSTESEETVDTYSPNTGDNSNAILYISLMSISIMAFAGIIIYRKKHSIR